MTWEQGAKAYRNDVTAMTKRRRNDIGTVSLRYRIRDQNDVVTTLPCYLGVASERFLCWSILSRVALATPTFFCTVTAALTERKAVLNIAGLD